MIKKQNNDLVKGNTERLGIIVKYYVPCKQLHVYFLC